MYMKKLFTTIIVLLLTVSVNVYAEDYNILVDENNNFTLKDSSNNPVTDNSIAKYENNTLTLGENKTFNEIKVKHDLTITSNDKEVYINTLNSKNGNNDLEININLDRIKVLESDNYKFEIRTDGNLNVSSSNINSNLFSFVGGYFTITNSTYNNKQSTQILGHDDNKNSFNSDNSIINITNQIFVKGNMIVKDSEITTNYYYISNGYSKIDNSTITVNGQLENYIPQSLVINDIGLSINNSKIKANYIIIDNGVIIRDSEISIGENLSSGSLVSYDGNVEINNSKLFVSNYIQPYSDNKSLSLIIENSDVEAGYIYTNRYESPDSNTNSFYAKNSTITAHGDRTTLNGDSIFDSCKINIQKSIHSNKNVTILNSSGVLSNITMIDNNLTIKDSIIHFLNETNETGFNGNLAPLIVNNDLIINNSNIVFDNSNFSNKALYVQGNVILDDKIIPIDKEKIKLKRLQLEDDTTERSICRYCFDEDRPIYIYAYEDNTFSDYVKLATTKTISFRVRNGTWLDGTKDDINLDYFYGEKIEVDSLPEEVKKLLTSKMGEWSVDLNNLDPTKDQEIEFRYNIINPETATNFILLTIVVSLTLITIYKTRKKVI